MWLIKNRTIRQLFGVVETGNLLFLKLLFKNPAAARVYPNLVFRDYMRMVKNDQWPSRTIFEICEGMSLSRVTIEHLPGTGSNPSLAELGYLAIITRAVAPKKIFEIGTFRGRTALNFALNSPDDCTIYTMDLPPDDRTAVLDGMNVADANIVAKSQTGADYKDKDVSHKIQQLLANSMRFDFSPYHGAIDIVFIDGGHHYDAVASDTKNALAMVRPGGFIIWHDFANYGDYNDVTRAILAMLPPQQVMQIDNTELAVYRKPAK